MADKIIINKDDKLTNCHAATHGESSTEEEQGKDCDHVGRDLEQAAVFDDDLVYILCLYYIILCYIWHLEKSKGPLSSR